MINSTEKIRIISNYMRMALTVCIGLWMIRTFVVISPDAYAVIALVATSVGVSGMLQEMVRGAMVPELGLAYHGRDFNVFRQTFSTAFVLSLIAAAFGAGVLITFYLVVDQLSIAEGLRDAAAILLLTRAAQVFVAILLAPAVNLLPVQGRMVAHNVWMMLERAAEAFAVAIVVFMWTTPDTALLLTRFAYLSAIFMVLVSMGWAAHGLLCDRRVSFSPALIRRDAVRQVAKTVGWNGFVVVSFNLYLRFDLFLMNILFGVAGTVIFGLASQLASYVRQLSIGFAQGFDAVMAKAKSNAPSGSAATQDLVDKISMLQAQIIFPATAFMLVNSEDFFKVWIGDRLHDMEGGVDAVILTFDILVVGIAARGLSEGWMKFLSGTGEVRAYAPVLLAGAVFNPVAIFILLQIMPAGNGYLSAAISFSLLMFIIHLLVLPKIVARHTRSSVSHVVRGFWRPFALAITASLLCMLVFRFADWGAWGRLLGSGAIFGIVCGPDFIMTFLGRGRRGGNMP